MKAMTVRVAWSAVAVLSGLGGLCACTQSHGAQAHDAAAADSSAGADAGEPRDCNQPSECAVVPMSCCGVCGGPSATDMTAIRKDAVPARSERCKTALCPKCAQRSNPELVATCRSGRCEAVDIAASTAVSGCKQASDCRVRVAACCECGGDTSPYALLAIASTSESAYTQLVCDLATACPECAPLYPSNVSATCTQSEHCVTQVH
jgi:hypothetical protein